MTNALRTLSIGLLTVVVVTAAYAQDASKAAAGDVPNICTPAASTAQNACTAKTAKAQTACTAGDKKDGWCPAGNVGVVDGVQIKSRKLYDALQGELVSADKSSCSGCKAAATKAVASKLTSDKPGSKTGASKKGAACCGKTFVGKKSYRSSVAAILASGHPVDVSKLADSKCAGCKSAAKSDGDGFCKECDAGLVAGKFYKGKDNFAKAKQAYATLVKASKVADKCEGCAVAMVTDGKCDSCKVAFKDGKMIK